MRTRNQIWKMLDFHGIAVPEGHKVPTKADLRNLRSLEVPEKVQEALRTYLDLLEFLWKEQLRLRTQLRSLTQKERYRKTYDIIRSAPGIGWFTAIRMVLELGEDLHGRFPSKAKIASFMGLTGGEHSTGETVHKGSLTGLGHKRSRTWLVECAWGALRKDPVLLEKFSRVYHNTGNKKKAIVAVARKLIGRILRCVATGQPYATGLVATGCEVE